jgi:hypothetical protein
MRICEAEKLTLLQHMHCHSKSTNVWHALTNRVATREIILVSIHGRHKRTPACSHLEHTQVMHRLSEGSFHTFNAESLMRNKTFFFNPWFCFETGCHYVAQAGLKLTILLLLLPPE